MILLQPLHSKPINLSLYLVAIKTSAELRGNFNYSGATRQIRTDDPQFTRLPSPQPTVGFEPTTYSLQNCCSTVELSRLWLWRAGKTVALPTELGWQLFFAGDF